MKYIGIFFGIFFGIFMGCGDGDWSELYQAPESHTVAIEKASQNGELIIAGVCNANEFFDKKECKPFRTCEVHQYEHKAPSKTSDRLCKDITICGDQQFEKEQPSKTSDRICGLMCEETQVYDALQDLC